MSFFKPVQFVSDKLYLTSRPNPRADDDQYDYETSQSRDVQIRGRHSNLTNMLQTFQTIKSKGAPELNLHVIEGIIDKALHPNEVDDRKGAFAQGLGALAKLPPNCLLARDMSHKALNILYGTVPHPPAALLGPEHAFRAADGGGNNLQDVNIGRAGTGYARSVQPQRCIAPSSLPDPGVIFDTLLKRRGHVDHPAGISSFTFAFATLVTHSVFRTNPLDSSKNDTSSYLDLSPLYGHNQQAQDLVRDKLSGRGLIYKDTFSEERVIFLPPAASVILIILSRNHNYIAERLLKLNERGRWVDPPPTDPVKRDRQDEEIFQTARLVNCGHFMSLILGDYAASFLGLAEGVFWDIPAFEPIKLKDGIVVDRGRGNHVSVEFNLMYRWHATLSKEGEKWADRVMNRAFDGKPFDQINMGDFCKAMRKVASELPEHPKDRVFGGLTRQGDGTFADDHLAEILLDATGEPGGAWRARGAPESLRIIEIAGILQARKWGVCTMNEFRKFLGLKQFASFEEWNPDRDVANAARRLYGHIDNLELYTGFQGEQTMPVETGSRIAAGFTTTRAVLGDAIAMIRGDRFYTSDFTPANLTSWGFQDCRRDYDNGSFGSEMPKLLMRVLPHHYPYNNVYGIFPFFTPTYMKTSLTKRGVVDNYDFERPVKTTVTVLDTFTTIRHVLKDDVLFKNVYEANVPRARGFKISIMASNRSGGHDVNMSKALQALFSSDDSLSKYRAWYSQSVKENLADKSWQYDGVPGKKYVDIVRDVINATAVDWAAERLCGISLKKKNQRGEFTRQEVYNKLSTLYSAVFLSFDIPEHAFALRSAAKEIWNELHDAVENAITSAVPACAPSVLYRLLSPISNYLVASPGESIEFLTKLAESGMAIDELAPSAIMLALCTSVNFAHAAVLVVDFYLKDEQEGERIKLWRLVNTEGASKESIIPHVREAMRLNPECTGLYREATSDAQIPAGEGKQPISVRKGDRIWASFKNAHLNPAEFTEPQGVDVNRPQSSYDLTPMLRHPGGADLAVAFASEVLWEVFKLKNVKRADGVAGRLAKFTTVINKTDTDVYVTPTGETSPFPGSMQIMYDI